MTPLTAAAAASRRSRERPSELRCSSGPPSGHRSFSCRGTLASLGARRPRRGAETRKGGGQLALRLGNPPGRTRPEESPRVRCARWSSGVRMAGSRGAFRWRVQGRTATHGRPRVPELRGSLLPRSTPPPPPPPAGTSASADWLMCPWKWLFKKLSQPRKIVISPSSQTLVELSRISIPYCGPRVEENRSFPVSPSSDEEDKKFTRKGDDYTFLENENKEKDPFY